MVLAQNNTLEVESGNLRGVIRDIKKVWCWCTSIWCIWCIWCILYGVYGVGWLRPGPELTLPGPNLECGPKPPSGPYDHPHACSSSISSFDQPTSQELHAREAQIKIIRKAERLAERQEKQRKTIAKAKAEAKARKVSSGISPPSKTPPATYLPLTTTTTTISLCRRARMTARPFPRCPVRPTEHGGRRRTARQRTSHSARKQTATSAL